MPVLSEKSSSAVSIRLPHQAMPYHYTLPHLLAVLSKHHHRPARLSILDCSQLDMAAVYQEGAEEPAKLLLERLQQPSEDGDIAALQQAVQGVVWTGSLRRLYTLTDRHVPSSCSAGPAALSVCDVHWLNMCGSFRGGQVDQMRLQTFDSGPCQGVLATAKSKDTKRNTGCMQAANYLCTNAKKHATL